MVDAGQAITGRRLTGQERPRWRLALLLGFPALLAVVAALVVSTLAKRLPPLEEGALVVKMARVEASVDGIREVHDIELPFRWDSLYPGAEGTAVVTIRFDLAEVPAEPWSLQLGKAGNAFEIRLNGLLVERNGDLDVHGGPDFGLLRRFVPLGPGLVQGSNELTIRIRADRGRDAGISGVVVGPAAMLRDDHAMRREWAVLSTAVICAASVTIGVLSLGFWRSQLPSRRPGGGERLFLDAAIAEFSVAAVIGTQLIGSPPIPWPWWGVAWNTLLSLAILFSVSTFIEIARWGGSAYARWLRRWMQALVLAGTVMVYAALGAGKDWALLAWYWALGITVILFGAVFLLRALRAAGLDHQIAAIAVVANLAAGIHDIETLRSSSDDLQAAALVVTSTLFCLTLAIVLVLRFRESNRRFEELLRTLEARVAAREEELATSYQKLEIVAREQERLRERTSILRDMHDGVGARLSMALRQIESQKPSDAELVLLLRDALDQLKLTIDSVNLPAGDVASLMGNLRYRIGPRIEATGIALGWDVDRIVAIERLDAQAMRQLMFILFEAISNALQHSAATEMRIEAREAGGEVQLRVTDNGVGFDAASPWERGLLLMKGRAEQIGARLDIRSEPGLTCVEVRIPR